MLTTTKRRSDHPRLLFDRHLDTYAETKALRLKDAKDHLNVRHSDDDALIQSQINAVEDLFERVTGHCLDDQSRRAQFDRVNHRVRLPKTPVQEIEAIEVMYQGSVKKSLTLSNFFLYSADPYEVRSTSTVSWPHPNDAYRIEYRAGYTDDENVPDGIREVLRKMVADLYTYRTTIDVGKTGTADELPADWRTIITPYVLPKL